MDSRGESPRRPQSTRPRSVRSRGLAGSGGNPHRQAPAVEGVYGLSCAVPGSATAPGAGQSNPKSPPALKLGGMQKMLTSVEACAAPSLIAPLGMPVSVIVSTPPPPRPKAPWFRCSQSGQAPFPSVQAATGIPPTLQALNDGWSHDPIIDPLQHSQGVRDPVHPALCGQNENADGSPSKQPVLPPTPLALASRQKPQKTFCWPRQVPAPAPVQQSKGCPEAVHCAFAL